MVRHPLDTTSLLAGLAFVLLGFVTLIGDPSFGDQAGLVWPVLLAALGASLLLSGIRRGARPKAEETPAEVVASGERSSSTDGTFDGPATHDGTLR